MKLKRMMLFSFLFVFFSGSVFADDMKVKIDDVVYYKNGKEVRGYLATPGDNKKHPGMILIHEWWGLNEYSAKRYRLCQAGVYGSGHRSLRG